jgi:putative oxidoreductase
MPIKSGITSPEKGLAVVRIIVGGLTAYHGQEIFDPELMSSYLTWDTFKFPAAKYMVYAGKLSELVGGLMLMLGWFTRMGAILVIGTLSYVTFFVGNGRFWYQDQHPFMFVLFGVLYLLTGPGTWSIDGLRKKR